MNPEKFSNSNSNKSSNTNNINVNVNIAHPNKLKNKNKSSPNWYIRTFIGAVITLLFSFFGYYIKNNLYKSPVRYNIAGAWKLKFTNNYSSYKPFIGESHTQKVFWSQNENNITGNGEKWEYNDKLLPSNMHRKLEYSGSIEANCLKAVFKLFGLKRESSGSIEVILSEDGKKMKGTFIGTAGDTKGTVTGEKID